MRVCKWIALCFLFGVMLSSCSFVSQQLADKAMEDRLLKSGALDSPIPWNLKTYSFRFLDRYWIRHGWPVSSSCRYGSLRASAVDFDGFYRGGPMYVFPIYEREGSMWQERLDKPPTKVNAFFRSLKTKVPISVRKEGDLKGGLAEENYTEREDGFTWMCGENWIGLEMSVAMKFHQRSQDQWAAILDETFPQQGLKKTWEKIGNNTWMAYTAALQSKQPNMLGGPYKIYVTPVADSGFTIAISMRANQDSIKNPEAFQAMDVLFHRLLESVKVEPWTDLAASEVEETRLKAMEILKQDCFKHYKNKPRKAPTWCQPYLKTE